MTKASLYLIFDNLISAAGRFIIIFLALQFLDDYDSRNFYNFIGLILFFISFCHLGSNNILIGYFNKKKNNQIERLFFLRLLGAGISSILWISFNINDYYFLPIVLIFFVSHSFSYLQIHSIVNPDLILKNRLLIEVLGLLLRLIIFVFYYPDFNFIIFVIIFLTTDLIYFLNNSKIFIKFLKKSLIISRRIKFSDLNIIFQSFFIVSLLFLFQRGDVFLYTFFNDALEVDFKKLIYTQQFIDATGIVSFSLIPLIIKRKYIGNTFYLKLLPFIFLVSLIPMFINFSNYNYPNYLDYFFHYPQGLPLLLLVGFLSYSMLIFLHVYLYLNLIIIILFVMSVIRLSIFFLIPNLNFYFYFLFIYSLFMIILFFLTLILGKKYENSPDIST